MQTEKANRLRTNKLKQYQPYAKQREFHEKGSTFRERLLMAGNQLGKCRTYDSEVLHPDGAVSQIGKLFDKGEPFDVLAWDGKQQVSAAVSHVIKKPAEECVEVFLSNGRSFKASLDHVVLSAAGWLTLRHLLQFAPCLPRSNSEPDQSVHASGAGYWRQTTEDWPDRYSEDSHLCDGQPHCSIVGAPLALKPAGGALLHTPAVSPSGSLAHTCIDIAQRSRRRLSNWCVDLLSEARSVAFLASNAYTPARSRSPHIQAAQRIAAVSASLFRSCVARLPGQWSKNVRALVSPDGDVVDVLAYMPIGVHDLYDMTVPVHANYIADGIVHHNTVAGAAEVAMHLTGQYPDDWTGKRFLHPVTFIAGSESAELTRDGVQRLLVGPPDQEENWGTGFIPASALANRTRRMGVSNALDSITVHHVSGGLSTLLLKSYDQGRSKWQANTVHGVWFDEEPPEDVYFEGITRTNATGGMILVTFTPLKGMSGVVARYLLEESEDRTVITMTIEDAEHYTEAERAKIIASYPDHEREARTKGIPTMGSGLIFPILEDEITVQPFLVPEIWPRIGALDFGWDHPTAAVELAWDRDSDIIYLTKCYRKRQATPIIHAAALKPWGANLPWAWPHDGNNDTAAGENLKSQYEAQGLLMLPERATFEDGSNSVEAGLMEMLDRMQTGRFKVFSTCGEWFEERRIYHRKDGKVVKERDDVISASRYAVMMKRFAAVLKQYDMPQVQTDWVN